MSNGLPFLNKLRKPELAEIAERTDLQEYVYLLSRAVAFTAKQKRKIKN
jgi:hypothetical protein